MKKHTEKPPIDELFARKLGNMSLPPSRDGFERLQARMNQQKPETRMVFWRNPSIRPYMAAAACLLVVFLFGWLYWPSGSKVESTKDQLAVAENTKQQVQPGKHPEVNPAGTRSDNKNSELQNARLSTDQVAGNYEPVINPTQKEPVTKSFIPGATKVESTKISPIDQPEAVLAETKPAETKENLSLTSPNVSKVVEPVLPERLAETKPATKPTPPAERVLEVTIAEPQALVAARQEAKAFMEEKMAVSQNDKVEKESKGNLWQQVKRIKQGEVFAREDNINNEDRGLLGRAYSGLKHSLDKDKAAKQ